MIAVVLAAGYATRLYPLTKDFPKPLLEVAGRSILDRILDNALGITDLEQIVVVTNHRFVAHFEEWRAGREGEAADADTRSGAAERAPGGVRSAGEGDLFEPSITILDDGSTDNGNRIGALGDLRLAVDWLTETQGELDQPVLVLAGDNLFDFELFDFAEFARRLGTDCITTHQLKDVEQLRRTGVVELATDSRVLSFEEKPEEPKSSWAVPPLYIYRPDTLTEELPLFLDEGNDPDAPGSFVPWLIVRKAVYAYPFEGARHDIGSRASYEAAQQLFAKRAGEPGLS
jgi:glucose-1-phosphate thymidylyltransferase